MGSSQTAGVVKNHHTALELQDQKNTEVRSLFRDYSSAQQSRNQTTGAGNQHLFV